MRAKIASILSKRYYLPFVVMTRKRYNRELDKAYKSGAKQAKAFWGSAFVGSVLFHIYRGFTAK